jgi:hypothetical protein
MGNKNRVILWYSGGGITGASHGGSAEIADAYQFLSGRSYLEHQAGDIERALHSSAVQLKVAGMHRLQIRSHQQGDLLVA